MVFPGWLSWMFLIIQVSWLSSSHHLILHFFAFEVKQTPIAMFRLYWNGQCLPRKNGRLAHVGMFKTFLVLLVLHGRGKYHLHYCFLNISTNLFLCFPMKRQKRYLGVSRIGGNVNSDHHLALLVGMPRNHRNTSETKSFALTSLFLMKSTKIPRNSSFDTNSWLPNVIKKLG